MLTQENYGVPMQYHSMLQDLPPAAAQDVQPVQFREYGDRARAERREMREGEMQIRKLEQQLEEQAHAHRLELERVRHQAFEEGRKKRETEEDAGFATVRATLERAITAFAQTRDNYLKDVEREVVHLALALAERILHREAQVDPLLLAGVVRVALGQLGESTDVRLRVPSTEQVLWTEMLRLMPRLPLRPELIADERMQAGECAIESHLGTVDLGVRAQLAEVERGFFDLLAHRDSASHSETRA